MEKLYKALFFLFIVFVTFMLLIIKLFVSVTNYELIISQTGFYDICSLY